MRYEFYASGALLLLAIGGGALAEEPRTAPSPNSNGNYVTRKDYDKLQKQMLEMKAELDAIKQDKVAARAEADQTADDIQKDIRTLHQDVLSLRPGFNSVLIAGDASFGWSHLKGSPSSFDAGFSPLILWELNDRLLFEGALDFALNTDGSGNSSTSVDLTIADLTYLVNDYLTVGGGLFVTPFGVYHNHFDPSWINKFPDDPLAFGGAANGGIAPGSSLGVFAEGGAPVGGPGKITYAIYAINGPRLITDDPNAAGSLDFSNFADNNDGKSFGGRIGYLPVPELEIGYSIQDGQAASHGLRHNVNALLQGVDVEYKRQIDPILGVLDLRAEYVFSHVDRATYGTGGTGGFGPLNFSNDRSGGYAQAAYRPTMVGNRYLKNVELALRYDWLFVPKSAPGGDFEQRWTFGVDYWVAPNAVFKIAYELDSKDVGTNTSGFLVQFGIGL